MADDSKVAEGLSVADEWDMLSLTSWVYTVLLFVRGFDLVYVPEYGNVSNSQQGPNPGLFTSDDCVFPPSEHENLPIESELGELNTNNDGQEGSCAGNFVECNELHKEVDDRSDESLSVSSDLLSASETTRSDLKPPEIHPDKEKDNTKHNSDLPCEGWCKSKSTNLCHHIKGVTTVCSIVAAGALVGIVIMGQRWQQDKWHLHQFQFGVSGETTPQNNDSIQIAPTIQADDETDELANQKEDALQQTQPRSVVTTQKDAVPPTRNCKVSFCQQKSFQRKQFKCGTGDIYHFTAADE